MANNIKDYIFLHGILFFYAICILLEKYTSSFDIGSYEFYLFYFIVVIFLGVYAISWQQILKRLDLNIVFVNKAIVVVWGIILGYLVFKETIEISTIVGAIIVILGIIMVVRNQ